MASERPEEERFLRVVGKRLPAPAFQPPPPETRAALNAMADFVTRSPKGVFRYASHADANEARERWLVDAMIARRASHG